MVAHRWLCGSRGSTNRGHRRESRGTAA